MKKTYLSVLAFALIAVTTNHSVAQNIGINGDGSTPDASSMLEIKATNKGLLIPRVSLSALNMVNPITSPATSLMVYNTNTSTAGANQVTPGYYYWDGAKWVRFQTGANVHNTLDKAYNEGGPGVGRIISANNGPVEIKHTSAVVSNRAMKITTDQPGSFGLEVINSGTGVGVKSQNSNPANNFAALQAETNSLTVLNSAIFGSNSGAGYGVSGQIPVGATGDAAVFGNNLNTNIPTAGVFGKGFIGIYGETNNIANGGFAGYFAADVGVDGDLYAFSELIADGDIVSFGDVYAQGGMLVTSDLRLKSNIVPIESALEKIMQLQPKHYKIKTKSKNNIDNIVTESFRQEYGVIAQELEMIFPDMISEKAIYKSMGDNTEYKTVNYTQLIPVLIQAMKEQQEMIENQNEKIEILNQKINQLTR